MLFCSWFLIIFPSAFRHMPIHTCTHNVWMCICWNDLLFVLSLSLSLSLSVCVCVCVCERERKREIIMWSCTPYIFNNTPFTSLPNIDNVWYYLMADLILFVIVLYALCLTYWFHIRKFHRLIPTVVIQ